MGRLTERSLKLHEYMLKNPTQQNCRKAIDKLGTYEDLEELGLLHIAPLKDGTPIFIVEEDWVFDGVERYITKTSYLHGVTEYEIGELNKDYWLTYEVAEKVLSNK